jgi:hypothetical protein
MHAKSGIGALISGLAAAGLQVSGYQNIYLALVLWGLAGVLLLYSLRDKIPMPPMFWWPFGMIPLRDGAKRAYEQLRGTIWAEAAERLRAEKTPDGILDYIAVGIGDDQTPIYAKHPPSERLEPVTAFEMKTGWIRGGARFLQLRDDQKTVLTDLSIKRRDLAVAIKRMRDGG